MSTQPHEFRAAAPSEVQNSRFGLLAELAGNWVGSGFNLISRPGQDVNLPFVLQVNATKEWLTFEPVGGPIPDRGSVQPDIDLFAMTYLQQVSDATSNGLLHIERGMWVNVSVPASSPPSIARLATIPHGDSVLAQGTGFRVTAPQIAAVSPMPFNVEPDMPPLPLGYFPPPFVPPNSVNGPLPPGFDITNPNAALNAAIKDQNITHTVVLQISTTAQPEQNNLPSLFGGGILNIPFVTVNANALSLDATFWIETVEPAGEPPFLQLQYTQTVILSFLGINWPHISVATLIKN